MPRVDHVGRGGIANLNTSAGGERSRLKGEGGARCRPRRRRLVSPSLPAPGSALTMGGLAHDFRVIRTVQNRGLLAAGGISARRTARDHAGA